MEPSAPALSPSSSGSSTDVIEKPPPYEEAAAAGFTVSSSPLMTKEQAIPASVNVGAVPPAAPPTVVISYGMPSLSPSPIPCICPHCNASIVSQTTTISGNMQYLACCILCFLGCSLGCCFIPFCMDSLSDVEHKCPQCNHFLGTYRRC
uniref:LITAF domain-containing protein n=1 Tax=Romanomermis culicivorax TaxID=13658 RepID=A0A915KY35_ROMCU